MLSLGKWDRLVGLLVVSMLVSVNAQADSAHDKKLYFSTPFRAINPMPENELRLDYQFEKGSEGVENEIEAEVEYKITDELEVEIEVPYKFVNPNDGDSENAFGNLEVGVQVANYAFAEHNLLLSYGAAFSLPTGDEDKGIGSDTIVKFEPYYSFGYMLGETQLILSSKFEIPLNADEDEDDSVELAFNASASREICAETRFFLELDGDVPLGGDERGVTVVNLNPGVKYELFDEFYLGAMLGFPLTDNKDFDIRAQSMAIYEY